MIRQVIRLIILASLAGLISSACGISQEAAATMTASVWTPTPVPSTATPIPTPVPYNLNVKVNDELSQPITLAYVSVNELGEGYRLVDEKGEVFFENLPGENVSLVITAPGYLPADKSETINRGENNIEVMLNQDPAGFKPAEACRQEETLVAIEDFQDSQIQEWKGVMEKIEFNMPGWLIQADLENTENQVLIASAAPDYIGVGYTGLSGEEGVNFTNVVWRLKLKVTNLNNHIVFWIRTKVNEETGKPTTYLVRILKDRVAVIRHQVVGEDFAQVASGRALKNNKWYNFEIAYFNGTISVWIDGNQWATYTDPQPWDEGGIGLNIEMNEDTDAVYYFDDFALCELNAPFETIIKEE